MPEIVADPKLIAFCGLYCGACKKYLAGSCPGCRDNAKASWCKVRACGLERGYGSCADCTELADVRACGKHNNVVSKLFGLLFRSDRAGCVDLIKQVGRDEFAHRMAAERRQSVRRT